MSRPDQLRSASAVDVHSPDPQIPSVAEDREHDRRPGRAPRRLEVVTREVVAGELGDLAEVHPVRSDDVGASERVEQEPVTVRRPLRRSGLSGGLADDMQVEQLAPRPVRMDEVDPGGIAARMLWVPRPVRDPLPIWRPRRVPSLDQQ